MNLALFSQQRRQAPRARQVLGQLSLFWLFFEGIAAGSPATPPTKIAAHEVFGSGTQTVFVRRYKPEDFTFSTPEPANQGRSLSREISAFVQSVGNDKATYDAFQQIHSAAHGSNLRSQDIAHFFSPGLEANGASSVAVSEKLREGTSREVSNRILRESVYLRALRGGMQFNMNLSSLGKKTESAPAQPRPLRYGLVLRGIEPSFDGIRSAAIGEFRAEDLAHAGKAKPVWGIGPVQEEAELDLTYVTAEAGTESGWSHLLSSLPRPDFSGKIEPKAAANLSGGALPPTLITMNQVEGLYRLEYHTKENFKKEAVLHGVSVPVYERVRVGQTLSETWHQEKTSVENIFNEMSGPRMNVHYITKTERYQSDLLYRFNGAQMTFTTDAPQNWKPGKSSDERYELKIERNF